MLSPKTFINSSVLGWFILKNVTSQRFQVNDCNMKRIERTTYLNKLIAFKDKDVIKVITGIRSCGKSTIMEIYRDWLTSHGVGKEQIIYLNFEDYDYNELRDPHKLYDYIKPRILTDRMNYIFFDEIQHVADFPDIVNSLNLKSTVDLYVTGSNAYMLSSDIATLLSGRYVEIAMLPLSFKEYVEGTGGRGNLADTYLNYITRSSFPYTVELDTPTEISDYLNGLYNTIVVKDIMSRQSACRQHCRSGLPRHCRDRKASLCHRAKWPRCRVSWLG